MPCLNIFSKITHCFYSITNINNITHYFVKTTVFVYFFIFIFYPFDIQTKSGCNKHDTYSPLWIKVIMSLSLLYVFVVSCLTFNYRIIDFIVV